MKVGIRLPQTGEHAKPENVIYLAEAADKSGFDSLWVLERLLWPITPQTKHPSTPTGNFPQDWQNVLEPLELLSLNHANGALIDPCLKSPRRPTSPSVFPRSRRLLRSDFLSKHDTELSKHDIKPIEVCRIGQHLIQFC
jgi:hypothetical protein